MVGIAILLYSHKIELSMFQIYHVQEGRTKHSRFFDEDLEDHQPFPTLQQALEVLDPTVGFNVEVKWTMQLKVQFILCKLNLKFYLTKLQTDFGDIWLSYNFYFLLFGIQKLFFSRPLKHNTMKHFSKTCITLLLGSPKKLMLIWLGSVNSNS